MDWFWSRVTQYAGGLWGLISEDLPALVGRVPRWIGSWWNETVEQPGNEALERYIQELEGRGLEAEIAEELREAVRDLPVPFDTVFVAIIRGIIAASGTLDYVGAVKNLTQRRINADLHPNLAPPEVILRALLTFPQDAGQASELLHEWGLDERQQQLYLDALTQLPALGELLTLVNRQVMSEDDAVTTLQRQGYTPSTARDLMELRRFWPSPQDVVTLAGREAFEEDAISRFDLDADMPEEMFEVAEKAGISREVIRWFWVAHWQNPSLQQVFSMIHRGATKPDGSAFTLDDLDTYYRLTDINPFFGDMLRQIAYTPLTRVDIRRFYERDIIDRDQVVDAYKALGYNDENAEINAQFADEERRTYGRDLSRTQLEKLYRMGVLDTLELQERFELIGYDEEEAVFLVHLLDAEIQEDQLASFIERAEYEFKRRQVDEIEVEQTLSNEGLSTQRIDQLLTKWRNEMVTERTLPTRANIVGWAGSGIVSFEEFVTLMRLQQYDDVDIARYGAEADLDESKLQTLARGEWPT